MRTAILVDDHRMFRESLRKLLVSEKILDVIAEANNGKQFLEQLEKSQPDIVLMDISMPVMDGIEASKLAVTKYPELKILALSSFGDEKHYYRMLDAGVKGFVLKTSGITELAYAVEELASGGNWFSSDLLQQVIIDKTALRNIDISVRELEVLALVCEGLTNDQIGEKLHLSSDTIKWHRTNLLSKSGCTNTASLVMYSIKNKLIKI
jgi:DNA-binding NarL/FixJ family response regulator